MAAKPNGGVHQPDAALIEAALQLKSRGYAVIDSVISTEECERFIDHCWSWLESLGTGISRCDPATWLNDRWPPTFGDTSGIVNCLEVGHQDFVWELRKDPRIVEVFEAMWGTNELLTSFDGINIMRPWCVTHGGGHEGRTDMAYKPWWHTDQRPSKSGLHCIQGFLTLTPVGDDAGTLEVKEGSHSAHEDYWDSVSPLSANRKAGIGDWYLFEPEEVEWWHRFETKRLTGYKAGSLFLWDSRTVHQNSLPRNDQLWRFVVYMCYQPASMATAADLALKRRAFEEYRVTTHWPAAGVCLPQEGSRDRKDFRWQRTRVEDSTVRRLAGVEAYPREEVVTQRSLLEHSTEQLQSMLSKAGLTSHN